MTTVVTLILIIFVALVYYLELKYKYWENRKVPFPKPTFLFGNISKVVLLKEQFSETCLQICKKFENVPFVGFFTFWTPSIVVQDPDLIKSILVKNFGHFQDNYLNVEPKIDPILAFNPICTKGDTWKTVRSKLSPQFTVAKLKSIIPMIEMIGTDLATFINAQICLTNSTTFNAQQLSARFTGESVFMAGYGLEGKSFVDEIPLAAKIAEEITSGDKIVQIKHLIGLFFPTLRRLLKVSFLGNPIPKSFREVIVNAIQYRKSNNVVRADYLDYLTKLKSDGNSISEDEIVGHAYTLYLDGYETTSLFITYLLYELALNLEKQEKCREEIKNVLEKYNEKLSHEALFELRYVDAAIYETLRLHSPVALMVRNCTKNFKIPFPTKDNENATVKIEKGTIVAIPSQIVHLNPKCYPDPDVFKPERFISDTQNNLFLGFGEGPRICLGRNFGILITKICLVSILSKYSVRMNKKTIVPYVPELLHIINVPKNEIYLDFLQSKGN